MASREATGDAGEHGMSWWPAGTFKRGGRVDRALRRIAKQEMEMVEKGRPERFVNVEGGAPHIVIEHVSHTIRFDGGPMDWKTKEGFREILALVDERVMQGKGQERHSPNGVLQHDDVWRTVEIAGSGFLVGQVVKDIAEFMRTGNLDQIYDAISYLTFLAQHTLGSAMVLGDPVPNEDQGDNPSEEEQDGRHPEGSEAERGPHG